MKRVVILLILMSLLFLPGLSTAADDGAVSILILGTDDLGDQPVDANEEMSRSDAIFVVTLQPKTEAIKLLSVERDYLVELPDGLGENKLATSSFFGGPRMTLDAVNGLLQLDITQYAHIDIKNLILAIDILGGVDVEVYEDEVEEVNLFINGILSYYNLSPVSAGVNHLDGPETWAFLAVRNNDIQTVESNSVRNDRQRRVMTACLEMFYDIEYAEIIRLASEIIPLIKTNLTVNDVLSFIRTALACDFDKITYMRTPVGQYNMKRINMHQVVIVDDMQREIENIHQFLYN